MMQRILRRLKWRSMMSLAVLLGLAAMGCERSSPPLGPPATPQRGAHTAAETVGEGRLALQVTFASWNREAPKPAAIQAIDAVWVYVYDDEGTEVTRQQLSVSAERASGRISVPANQALRVALVFFGEEVVRWMGERRGVSVAPGGETAVAITVDYMGTVVSAPAQAVVEQEYTVSWQARPLATGYELEEATAADFAGAVRHTSSGTSRSIPGKSAEAVGRTFYYRVRANTAYGYGPWHSQGAAAIDIYQEASEGVLIIEVPLPPEEPEQGAPSGRAVVR